MEYWSDGDTYILDFRSGILDLRSEPIAENKLFSVLIQNPNSKIQNGGTPTLQHSNTPLPRYESN